MVSNLVLKWCFIDKNVQWQFLSHLLLVEQWNTQHPAVVYFVMIKKNGWVNSGTGWPDTTTVKFSASVHCVLLWLDNQLCMNPVWPLTAVYALIITGEFHLSPKMLYKRCWSRAQIGIISSKCTSGLICTIKPMKIYTFFSACNRRESEIFFNAI